MEIKSNVNITYNTGLNSTESSKLIGKIRNFTTYDEFNVVAANYYYANENGDILQEAMFEIVGGEIDALYNLVKSELPDINTVGYRVWYETLLYLAFRVKMVETFNLTNNSEVDIIQ